MALSGAALPSLDGRPLPGLAALSFSVDGFCLTVFFSSLAASSRAAEKSTTLPECAGAGSSLPGVGGCICSFSAFGTSGAAGSSTSARVTASAGSGTASPISKSAACPSCSSMTFSASVSSGSGAGCSGKAAFSTVGAGASAGEAASGMFFLSSAICKPPFSWHEKSQSADWPTLGNLLSYNYVHMCRLLSHCAARCIYRDHVCVLKDTSTTSNKEIINIRYASWHTREIQS